MFAPALAVFPPRSGRRRRIHFHGGGRNGEDMKLESLKFWYCRAENARYCMEIQPARFEVAIDLADRASQLPFDPAEILQIQTAAAQMRVTIFGVYTKPCDRYERDRAVIDACLEVYLLIAERRIKRARTRAS